jgi:hypothetical protein
VYRAFKALREEKAARAIAGEIAESEAEEEMLSR